MQPNYHVYIISNYSNKVLYVGGTYTGFTQKYKIYKLLFLQSFETPLEAIAAEKTIKGWSRAKKLNLMKSINPTFKDLSVLV